MRLPQQARLMQSKDQDHQRTKETSIGDKIQRKGKAQIKTIKKLKRHLYVVRNTTPFKHHYQT